MLEIPKFETKKELFDFLTKNKSTLVTQKKSEIKRADANLFDSAVTLGSKVNASKSEGEAQATTPGELSVKAIINTTGIMDSHRDVHVKGLWNKSLKENKRIMHLQEHKSNSFEHIIASGEDVKASVKDYTWKELGLDAEGTTQALVFDSTVKESRNSYMYNQYKEGYVDNHSVGMQYVKLELAINDKDYEKEKDFWDKHIEGVVNRKDAENSGYFWVVQEAKVIEGSAVPNGSNPITPTQSIKTEPSVLELIDKMGTQKKAAGSTFDILQAINKQKINFKNS